MTNPTISKKSFPLSAGFEALGNIGRKPASTKPETVNPKSTIQLPEASTKSTQPLRNTPDQARNNIFVNLQNAIGSLGTLRLPTLKTKQPEVIEETNTEWNPTKNPEYQTFLQELGVIQQKQATPLEIGTFLTLFKNSGYQNIHSLRDMMQHLRNQSMDKVFTEQDDLKLTELFEAYEAKWLQNPPTIHLDLDKPTKPTWNPLSALGNLKFPTFNLNAKKWFTKKSEEPKIINDTDPVPVAKASLFAGITALWASTVASVSNTLSPKKETKSIAVETKISVSDHLKMLELTKDSRIKVQATTAVIPSILEVIQVSDDQRTVMARDSQGMVIHIPTDSIIEKVDQAESLDKLATSDLVWAKNPLVIGNTKSTLNDKSIELQFKAIAFLKKYKLALGATAALAAVIAYLVYQDLHSSNSVQSIVAAVPTQPIEPSIPQFGISMPNFAPIPEIKLPSVTPIADLLSRLNPADIAIQTPTSIPTTNLTGIENIVANNLSNIGAQVVEVSQRIWHDTLASHTGFHMDIAKSNIKLHIDPSLLDQMKSVLGTADSAQVLVNFADGTNQVVSIPLNGSDVLLNNSTEAYKAISSNTATHFEFGKLVNGAWHIFSSFKR
jgi:hypothetical protein